MGGFTSEIAEILLALCKLGPTFFSNVSATDAYFTVPLSLLHQGTSALDVLERGVSCGIVNAGIGHRRIHGEEAFLPLLDEAMAEAAGQGLPAECPSGESDFAWEAALVGARMLGVQGGSHAEDAATYYQHHRAGDVFFRIRADWLWNAVHSAEEAQGEGEPDSEDFKPLSWREFRVLAAILSAKVNTYGFTFLGWESIQARACGFHSKALFEAGKATLPAHCQPLSRDVIRAELEKLEALGFFARCRYAKGPRGGLMAYSLRHPDRQGLVQAIQKWAAANQSFKNKVTALRATDLDAFAGPQVKTTPRPQSQPALQVQHTHTPEVQAQARNIEAFATPQVEATPKPQAPARDISPLLASLFTSPRPSPPA
jgi:hypothetical protein